MRSSPLHPPALLIALCAPACSGDAGPGETGVRSVTVTASQSALPIGATLTLTAAARDGEGRTVSTAVQWSSSRPEVLGVDASGGVIALAAGDARVTATADGVSGSLDMEVVPTTGTGIASVDLTLVRIWKSMQPQAGITLPPGMAAAVVRDGRLVMARGYGHAATGHADAVEPTSLFRIASVSKPLTAIGVLKLVDDGLLSLDDRLLDLAPQIAPEGGPADARAESITVRQLLEHRAGWDRFVGANPNYTIRQAAADLGVGSPPSPVDFARWIFGKPLDYAPDARYVYDNRHYQLLAHVVEAAAGKPYEAYMRDDLLAPLGITRMRVGATLVSGRADGEVAYHFPGTGLSVFDAVPGTLPTSYGGSFDLALMAASGGWIASAVDLARLSLAVDADDDGQLLTADSYAYMTTDHSEQGVYGAGWILDTGGYNHTGALEGSNSILAIRRDGTTVVLLFNGNININFGNFVNPLLEASWPEHDLFGEYFPGG